MQAIEFQAQIDENSEIRIKLPDGHKRGPARVIVLLDTDETQAGAPIRNRPSVRLAYQGARLLGDDICPAIPTDEWGTLYQ